MGLAVLPFVVFCKPWGKPKKSILRPTEPQNPWKRRGKHKKQRNTSQRKNKEFPSKENVRLGFWQNGFFADFYFWAAGFFRGFCRRIFSPHFCGKKCPEKSSKKIPGKILQNLYNKNPQHISAEGPGQKMTRKSKKQGKEGQGTRFHTESGSDLVKV